MTDRELLQQALDALEEACEIVGNAWAWRDEKGRTAAETLRARLAQPDQPDYSKAGFGKPQREWQELTEEEIKHLWYEACQTNLELTSQLIVHLARNIEAKLKEKNT